jgi:hypothetical protein
MTLYARLQNECTPLPLATNAGSHDSDLSRYYQVRLRHHACSLAGCMLCMFLPITLSPGHNRLLPNTPSYHHLLTLPQEEETEDAACLLSNFILSIDEHNHLIPFHIAVHIKVTSIRTVLSVP